MIKNKQPTKKQHSQLQQYQSNSTSTSNRDYITLKNNVNKKNKDQRQKNKSWTSDEILQMATPQKYRAFLQNIKKKASSLTLDIFPQFDKQYHQLRQSFQLDHNICIYGSGSKIKLLQKIRDEEAYNYNVWQVRGYLPSLSAKRIYNGFGDFLVQNQYADKFESFSMKDMVKQYTKIIEKNNKITKIIVIFHSIDGPNLLDQQTQTSLAELFSMPKIQLIASLDSMKIVMNWSPILIQKFKFLFFLINTKHPYYRQQLARPKHNEKSQKNEQAFLYIWQSLGQNQKDILKHLAKNELQNFSRQQDNNYTQAELLDICIQNFILTDDSQLRQNLIQLLDHKVIIQRPDEKKNKKVYTMKYDRRLLQKIVGNFQQAKLYQNMNELNVEKITNENKNSEKRKVHIYQQENDQ